MLDRQQARQGFKGLPGGAVLAAAVAALCAGEASALPRAEPAKSPTPGVILIQDAASQVPQAGTGGAAGEENAPFAELNEALAAARARLEELSKAAAAAAAAGQARHELDAIRQENQRLRSELQAVTASRNQLQATGQNNATRVAALTKAAEDAAAEAKQIEEELVRMRWQNAQLNTSLARARADQEQTAEEARAAQQALTTKVETLSASAARSATEIARLRQELDDAKQRLEAAGQVEGRVTELQARLQDEAGRNKELEEQLAGRQGERDRLQAELAAAKGEVEHMVASRDELEQEVEMLRAAASSAADAARQNLLAVEERIKELNAALAGIEPAAGAGPEPPAADPAPPEPRQQVAALPARDAAPASDLELIKSANAAEGPMDQALTRLTPDLPLEMRLQVQGLLVDLGAKIEGGGLKVTVPGGDLFAINSETIESTAYDALAKVAELIDAYDDHEVMIVGHTDSIGEEAYNRALSRRRAELVKEFFIDNFEIEPQRLAIEGRGESQPIATNATVDGRQANRRVDVVILD